MSWLPMYLDDDDLPALASWLNDQEDIAFIMSAEQDRWRAVRRLDHLRDGDYQIWHIPSGPLPLISRDRSEPDGMIADPWEGWTGRSQGGSIALMTISDDNLDCSRRVYVETSDQERDRFDLILPARPAIPFFGAGCTGIIDLNLQTRPLLCEESEYDPVRGDWTWSRVVVAETIGKSSFGWIGNHYRSIGQAAHPSTERWWKRLRRWVASHGEKIPSFGPLS